MKKIIRTKHTNIYTGLKNLQICGNTTISHPNKNAMTKILKKFGDDISIKTNGNLYNIKKNKRLNFEVYLGC